MKEIKILESLTGKKVILFEEAQTTVGEISYERMRSFLEKITPYMASFETSYRGPHIQIPSDRNSSSNIYELDSAVTKLDTFNEGYGSEGVSYYIWKFEFKNKELNKQVVKNSSQRVNSISLYHTAKSNPGELYSISIGFTSNAQNEFGAQMSSGQHGSLD